MRFRLVLLLSLVVLLAPALGVAAPAPTPAPTPTPAPGSGTTTRPTGPVGVGDGASGADLAEADGTQVTAPTPPVTQPTTSDPGGVVPPPTTTVAPPVTSTVPTTKPTSGSSQPSSTSALPREAWVVLIGVLIIGLGVSARTIRTRERRIGLALLAFCLVYLGVIAALLTGVASAATAPPTGAVAVAGDGEVMLVFDAPPAGRSLTIVRASAGAGATTTCADKGERRWVGVLTGPLLDTGRQNRVASTYVLCVAGGGDVSEPVRVAATPTASADVTPPGRVLAPRLQSSPAGVTLSWRLPADADLARVVVVRAFGRPPSSPDDGTIVADGRVIGVVDHPFSTTSVLYAIFAVDTSGNASPPERLRLARYDPGLRTPLDGARVHGAIHLAWRLVPRATTYNVQLFRAGACCNPSRAARNLHSLVPALTVHGLTRGRYQWTVWASVAGRFSQLGVLAFSVS